MAKCVYDGKGYLPECEHCIDTVGTGVVCTHDCVIELREEIEKRDSLIKELANALECAVSGFSREVVTYGEAVALIEKARRATK